MNKSEPEQTFAELVKTIESDTDADCDQKQTIVDDEENVHLARVGNIQIVAAHHQFFNHKGNLCTQFYAELTCKNISRDFIYAIESDDQWVHVHFDLLRKAQKFVHDILLQNRAFMHNDQEEEIPSCYL